jgi:hypothetical protein
MPAGDLTQGYIFVPAEKNIDQVKMNAIVGQAYINPAFISGQTATSSTGTGDYFVFLQSGGTLAKILTQDLGNSLAQTSGFQSQIWSTRLRSFNSCGNPNFEVDQANCNAGVTNAPSGTRIGDRWFLGKGGTMAVTTQAQNNNPNVIPGTSYDISGSQLLIQLTTAQASLGATDALQFAQYIEGPSWRELRGDVHSISMLVYSTVAPLTFAVALRDVPTTTKSLVSSVTVPTANTWTLLKLPNLPVFPAGNFSLNPGSIGYQLIITLACGSTYLTPSPGVWVSGNYFGVSGMSNWCANPITSTAFYCAMIQHEPGSQCTTLMDCPFGQNLDGPMGCTRYYHKSYLYGEKPGTVNATGIVAGLQQANWGPFTYVPFKKIMAKVPTVTIYDAVTGAANAVHDNTASLQKAVTGVGQIGDAGYTSISLTSPNATSYWYSYAYIADTGW